MASLKDLKNRIKSVKSTQKITKAMKMVAAAKLRRAKEQAESARPYAQRLEGVLRSLMLSMQAGAGTPKLLAGTGSDRVQLLIVATSDRGLCGAFNSSILRAARRKINELLAQGKEVKIFCIGRKGYEGLNGEHGPRIVGRASEVGKKKLSFGEAEAIAAQVIAMLDGQAFDVATIVYNHFKSAISQVVTWQQLVPLEVARDELRGTSENNELATRNSQPVTPYEYEPSEEAVLTDLLPRNLGVQIYRALLENAASEQGARMTAMDNATRNAGEMIKKLTLVYNRTRQAAITKELIEIISGAEAV